MAVNESSGPLLSDDLESVSTFFSKHGFFPAHRESRWAMGCDLGQSVDPTAIAIVEWIREPIPATEPDAIGTDLKQRLTPPRYEVRHLARLPLQTSYPAVIAHVANLLGRPPLKGNCKLLVDMTGVGRPVVDMFTQAGLRPLGVTITAGDSERRDDNGRDHHVSKIQLVGRLQAEFHNGSLKIAKSLPEANVLAAELQDFRANISDSGIATFGARVGRHDDLVLALAIALWWLSRMPLGPSVQTINL